MLEELRQMINPFVVINISDADKTMLIKEDGSDSKIKKLLIKQVPDNLFAFSLDYQPRSRSNKLFKQLSCYINPACGSGVNKGCDFVAISQLNNGKCDVLICDLKSDRLKLKTTKKQLLNSELYVKYLMTMLTSHYEIDLSKMNITYRHVIISTCPRGRKNTAYKPNQSKASETNYKVVYVTVNNSKESCIYYGALK